MTLLMTYEEQY